MTLPNRTALGIAQPQSHITLRQPDPDRNRFRTVLEGFDFRHVTCDGSEILLQ
jgi:hypothetical protein